jgi:hypothetical protein
LEGPTTLNQDIAHQSGEYCFISCGRESSR